MTETSSDIRIEGFENHVLVRSEERIDPHAEGYSIEMFLSHDGINLHWAPLELGMFAPHQSHMIVSLVGLLGDAMG